MIRGSRQPAFPVIQAPGRLRREKFRPRRLALVGAVFALALWLMAVSTPARLAGAGPGYQPGQTFLSEPGFMTVTEPDTADNDNPKAMEMVFMLHGIGKGKYDMAAMGSRLRRAGYTVVNWGYPSTKYNLSELADRLADEVEKFPDYKIHFVTHSMGGIVVRTFFANHELPNPGRLVMIAPPSQGAELAQFFGDWPIYQYLLGPAGQELKPGDLGKCMGAGLPPVEFGIIAGGTGLPIGINPLLPGDNDGTVTVESTRLDCAADFALVPYPHPVIQMMPKTAELTIRFLETGKFE